MQRAISSRCWWKELMGLRFSPRDGNPCVIFMVSAGCLGFSRVCGSNEVRDCVEG